MNYYNEFDPKAAAWLRELIRQGLIPAGDVDERSITEIKPHELAKYTQCHFFAGIGGWSLALQLAQWPAARPVGTGSCPCQPFSLAGSGKGTTDERHLWPAFFKLIRECRALGQRWTDAIFGEQVESAIAHGWLDEVSADLEGEDYAIGSAILGAHSVGAPHRRQRLYWVAYADKGQCGRKSVGEGRESDRNATGREQGDGEFESGGADSSLALTESEGRPRMESERETGIGERTRAGSNGPNGVALGDTNDTGSQGRGLRPDGDAGSWAAWTAGVEFVACTDGRKRLVKSGIQPLAHGFPSRVGLLRGSGNAIVPQVAATFILSSEEARLP